MLFCCFFTRKISILCQSKDEGPPQATGPQEVFSPIRPRLEAQSTVKAFSPRAMQIRMEWHYSSSDFHSFPFFISQTKINSELQIYSEWLVRNRSVKCKNQCPCWYSTGTTRGRMIKNSAVNLLTKWKQNKKNNKKHSTTPNNIVAKLLMKEYTSK